MVVDNVAVTPNLSALKETGKPSSSVTNSL